MSSFFAILAIIVLGTIGLGPPLAAAYYLFRGFRILNQSQEKFEVIDRWTDDQSRKDEGMRLIRLGIIYAIIFGVLAGFILLLVFL